MSVDVDELAEKVAARLTEQLGVIGPMWSVARIAETLDVSERTVRDMIRRGRFGFSFKVEGSRRVEAAAVRDYLEQRREAPSGTAPSASTQRERDA